MGERELGTWLLSVAGILKGFLFNILVALKKKKAPPTKKKTPNPKLANFSEQERLQPVLLPRARAEGGVGASCLPETVLWSGHFHQDPCVCLAELWIGKTIGSPARFR